jgi:hypothetical protein
MDVLSQIPSNVGGRAVRNEGYPVWWHGTGPQLIHWQIHTKGGNFLVYICGVQGTHEDLRTAWNLAYDAAVAEGVEGIEDFPRIDS